MVFVQELTLHQITPTRPSPVRNLSKEYRASLYLPLNGIIFPIRWHDEKTIAFTSLFPQLTDVAFFFFFGVIVAIFALVFNGKETSILQFANEIGVEAVCGGLEPEGTGGLVADISDPIVNFIECVDEFGTLFFFVAVKFAHFRVVVFFEAVLTSIQRPYRRGVFLRVEGEDQIGRDFHFAFCIKEGFERLPMRGLAIFFDLADDSITQAIFFTDKGFQRNAALFDQVVDQGSKIHACLIGGEVVVEQERNNFYNFQLSTGLARRWAVSISIWAMRRYVFTISSEECPSRACKV